MDDARIFELNLFFSEFDSIEELFALFFLFLNQFDLYKKKSIANLPRAYVSGRPNFKLIVNKRAEIHSKEGTKELRRKDGNCVTVSLTFNQRSSISIGFEPVR